VFRERGFLVVVFLLICLILAAFPIVNIYLIYPAFEDLIAGIKADDAVRVSRHLASMFIRKNLETGETEFVEIEREKVEGILNDFSIYKIKVFDPSGRVLFSTDEEETGEINRKEYFISRDTKGAIHRKVIRKDERSLEGAVITKDVVETYVPVMDNGRFIGAFEIYYDITGDLAVLGSILRKSDIIPWSMTVLFALVILGAFLKIDGVLKKLRAAKTGLRQRGELLLRQKRFFEEVIEALPHPFAVIDAKDFRLLHANSSFSNGDAGGLHCYEVSHGRNVPCGESGEICPLREVLQRRRPVEVEHVHGSEGGSRIHEIHGYPIMNGKGEIVKMIEYCIDITERKTLEQDLLNEKRKIEELYAELSRRSQELEDNRNRLKTALDSISSLIHEVVVERSFHVRYRNPALKKCYEVKHCRYMECPCYGKEGMRCWTVAGTFCGGKVQGEFAKKYADCTKCEVFSSSARDPLFLIGELFNTMMEILEMKNRELEEAYKELKQTQSQILQQEKMASIGQLAAGVAHEINNPMGFISSNLTTLSKYVERLGEYLEIQGKVIRGEVGPEELKEAEKRLKIGYIKEDMVDLIKESLEGAERVKKIVRDLKSFSRVDEAEEKMADINECIESTLNIVWNELKYKARVVKEYGDIPMTRCYPQQLNQVFMNLLVNAGHAIEKEGEIRIRTSNGGGKIKVEISDTGCGIPEEIRGRIFEPFFTTKEVGKGTGLGLSITYDIIKKHGGEIEVESEVGKGTTFTITLPVREGN